MEEGAVIGPDHYTMKCVLTQYRYVITWYYFNRYTCRVVALDTSKAWLRDNIYISSDTKVIITLYV